MTDEYLYQFRLGNLLQEDSGEIINIGHIQKNFYDVLINGKAPGYYQPIELTDEWLDKFGIQLWQLDDPEDIRPFVGFKLTENTFLQKNYCRDGSGSYNGYLLVIKTGIVFRTVLDCDPIKTVHRLQNIVFALTGQELMLKEQL